MKFFKGLLIGLAIVLPLWIGVFYASAAESEITDEVYIIGAADTLENTTGYFVTMVNNGVVIVDNIKVGYPLSWAVLELAQDGMNEVTITPYNWFRTGTPYPFAFTVGPPGPLTDVKLDNQANSLLSPDEPS